MSQSSEFSMTETEFRSLLDVVCDRLTEEVRVSTEFHKPNEFEKRVRHVFSLELVSKGLEAAPNIDQGFPDIVVEQFGAEVKATESDNWRCIANSVSEGQRAQNVEKVFVIYGKMGGTPEVKWADYGQSIVHVRTSHVPRFEIEIGTEAPLFGQLGISYDDFRQKPMHEKMPFIREYARGRLRPGERLWWLEDKDLDEQSHSLSLEVKVYMDLSQQEKRKLRAEGALMCPQVVGGSRKRRKYVDVVMYIMTYRGVLCPQARDLFSAGSVAGPERGGNYLLRALADIQDEIRAAAYYLEDALFEEYWGFVPAPGDRIVEWLKRADGFASGWKPSEFLFLDEQRKH
jgi:hypothetical protein